jgi:hypothetical protein
MKLKLVCLSVVPVLIVILAVIGVFHVREKEEYEGVKVQETPLGEFVDLSEDSTYLVFAFIPSCEYCRNSIANLNEYEKKGVVDKVIGLTLNNSTNQEYLPENYRPDFRVIGCDIPKLLEFNNRFPTSFYVKNNVILKVFRGELPNEKKFFKKIKG